MPLLHNNEKYLLLNIFRALDFNILTLISNPQEFFGIETQIITVNGTENNESPINDDIEPINIDSLTTTSIQSGSVLKKLLALMNGYLSHIIMIITPETIN